MAIEYAKSALAESIIPVKDLKLTSTGTGENEVFIKVKANDVVQIDGGKINLVAPTSGFGVVTTVLNLGVCEGTNFEGLEQTRKVGKIRTSGNAIYRGEYGVADAGTGAFTAATITENLIGTEKALNKGVNGFNVQATGTSNLTVKIVDVDVKRGYVYFQFKASALVSS
jgi:hypothetical protein